MKKFKKLLSICVASLMAMSAVSTSAFAEKIPGFIYDEETNEVIYCEKDESELPGFSNNSAARYLPETFFNQTIAGWTQYTKLSPTIPLSSGEKYIYVEFDNTYDYYIRLRNAVTGAYLGDFLRSSEKKFFFENFPTNQNYNIYLSSASGSAQTMSGVIYTQ